MSVCWFLPVQTTSNRPFLWLCKPERSVITMKMKGIAFTIDRHHRHFEIVFKGGHLEQFSLSYWQCDRRHWRCNCENTVWLQHVDYVEILQKITTWVRVTLYVCHRTVKHKELEFPAAHAAFRVKAHLYSACPTQTHML